jgi:hypothetical protein
VSSTPATKPPAGNEPKGYQPSLGRKLFMLAICIVGLILVWTYYFHLQKP